MAIYQEQLMEELSKLEFDSLLDCGCGNRWLSFVKGYEGFDLPTNLNGKLPYRNKSYDVVLTAAVLCTMPDIKRAVRNIKRIARKYIVLLEFQGPERDYSTGDRQSVRIMRDYPSIFKRDFRMIDIPKSIWPGDGWLGDGNPGKIMIAHA